MYSDQGKEFAGAVATFLNSKDMPHKMVARRAHIEISIDLQRYFYRCLNMERGSVRSCSTGLLTS